MLHHVVLQGIRDLVAGQAGYLKITAHNLVAQPADETPMGGAHIEVSLRGTIKLGGRDVDVTIPGTVIARSEGIYSTGPFKMTEQNEDKDPGP